MNEVQVEPPEYFMSDEEAFDYIDTQEVLTGTRFICQKRQHLCCSVLTTLEKKRIRWQHEGIPFDGIPFVIVGVEIRSCRNGGDKHLMEKFERINVRKTSSVKVNCPAKFLVRKIVKFPEYQYDESGMSTTAMSFLLRDRFSSSTKQEYRVYLKFPTSDQHLNHPVGNAADTMLTIDPRLIQQIHERVKDGVRTIEEMRRHLLLYVSREILPHVPNITPDNQRFYPNDKSIRNHVANAFRMNGIRQTIKSFGIQKRKRGAGQKPPNTSSITSLSPAKKQCIVPPPSSLHGVVPSTISFSSLSDLDCPSVVFSSPPKGQNDISNLIASVSSPIMNCGKTTQTSEINQNRPTIETSASPAASQKQSVKSLYDVSDSLAPSTISDAPTMIKQEPLSSLLETPSTIKSEASSQMQSNTSEGNLLNQCFNKLANISDGIYGVTSQKHLELIKQHLDLVNNLVQTFQEKKRYVSLLPPRPQRVFKEKPKTEKKIVKAPEIKKTPETIEIIINDEGQFWMGDGVDEKQMVIAYPM